MSVKSKIQSLIAAANTATGESDATLTDAVQTLVDGYGQGMGGAALFEVNDFAMPSTKWVAQNCFPNPLASGGCIHLVYDQQTNPNASDRAILCFGVGTLLYWSPGDSNPSAYLNVGHGTNNLVFYARGVGNSNWNLVSEFADEHGELDVKLYTDHALNVKTNEIVAYSTAFQSFFTALSSVSYWSIGCNQSDPFAGAIIKKFALEES